MEGSVFLVIIVVFALAFYCQEKGRIGRITRKETVHNATLYYMTSRNGKECVAALPDNPNSPDVGDVIEFKLSEEGMHWKHWYETKVCKNGHIETSRFEQKFCRISRYRILPSEEIEKIEAKFLKA